MEDFETASAIDFYKQQCINKNTDRATSTWMRSWAVTKSMEPNIESVFMSPGEEYGFLSSSIVKDIAVHGGDLKKFVIPDVENALRKKFS